MIIEIEDREGKAVAWSIARVGKLFCNQHKEQIRNHQWMLNLGQWVLSVDEEQDICMLLKCALRFVSPFICWGYVAIVKSAAVCICE